MYSYFQNRKLFFKFPFSKYLKWKRNDEWLTWRTSLTRKKRIIAVASAFSASIIRINNEKNNTPIFIFWKHVYIICLRRCDFVHNLIAKLIDQRDKTRGRHWRFIQFFLNKFSFCTMRKCCRDVHKGLSTKQQNKFNLLKIHYDLFFYNFFIQYKYEYLSRPALNVVQRTIYAS